MADVNQTRIRAIDSNKAAIGGQDDSAVHGLKRSVKFGPAMSRQMRTEFTLCQVDAPPRRLRPEIAAKIRAEIDRLSISGAPAVQAFIRRMTAHYAELSL